MAVSFYINMNRDEECGKIKIAIGKRYKGECMGKDYYVGLDAGTGSLGWSVTNEKYEIQRSHGKALWGVRLFDAAETAEERRGFRTNRRRLDRRNWRLELLQ